MCYITFKFVYFRSCQLRHLYRVNTDDSLGHCQVVWKTLTHPY
jgi:hypothetical protein